MVSVRSQREYYDNFFLKVKNGKKKRVGGGNSTECAHGGGVAHGGGGVVFQGLAAEMGEAVAAPALRLGERAHHLGGGGHATATAAATAAAATGAYPGAGVQRLTAGDRKRRAKRIRDGVHVVSVAVLHQGLLITDRRHGQTGPGII